MSLLGRITPVFLQPHQEAPSLHLDFDPREDYPQDLRITPEDLKGETKLHGEPEPKAIGRVIIFPEVTVDLSGINAEAQEWPAYSPARREPVQVSTASTYRGTQKVASSTVYQSPHAQK